MNKHPDNLKKTWVQQMGHISLYAGFDDEYLRLFDENYSGFSGKVLEIGAGTGYVAQHVIRNYKVSEYTILDIRRNINQLKIGYLSSPVFKGIKYVESGEYEEALKPKYDLLITNQCLSETPPYYYKDILSKVSADNIFIIDESRDESDLEFNQILSDWAGSVYQNTKGTHRNFAVKGYSDNGIMVYIGKGKND